jgi:hypothetical protein
MRDGNYTPACAKHHTHDDVEPSGYVSWHLWALQMTKSHRQVKCPVCGLYAVWVLRAGTGRRGGAR